MRRVNIQWEKWIFYENSEYFTRRVNIPSEEWLFHEKSEYLMRTVNILWEEWIFHENSEYFMRWVNNWIFHQKSEYFIRKVNISSEEYSWIVSEKAEFESAVFDILCVCRVFLLHCYIPGPSLHWGKRRQQPPCSLTRLENIRAKIWFNNSVFGCLKVVKRPTAI